MNGIQNRSWPSTNSGHKWKAVDHRVSGLNRRNDTSTIITFWDSVALFPTSGDVHESN
jgi:hypothetical protein